MRDKIDVVVDGLIINPEGKMFLVKSYKWNDKYMKNMFGLRQMKH